MKLHLGCGDKRIDGFINIDLRASNNVDIVDDVATLQQINNNSVELIYASHVLEHFGRHEYTKVLKRWCECLKPGGVLRLAVPDFEAVVKRYGKSGNLLELRGLLYGGQNYKYNYHYCAHDFHTLQSDLMDLGFTNIRRYDWRNTEHADIDDFSQAYIPHLDRENGDLMSLNIEATKR